MEKRDMIEDKDERRRSVRYGSTSGGTYGLAFIGALIYFIEHASTFGEGVMGILKAIIWPALLIYRLFEYLKM